LADRYADGWVNVDWAGSPHRKDQEVDLTGELPWPENSIQTVYLGHILEHLTMPDCRLLLARLHYCAIPSGTIMVVGPDLPTAYRMAEEGTLDVTIDSLLYGAERWPGDRHLWSSSAFTVNEFLVDTGWSDIHDMSESMGEVAAYWPVADPRPKWQFALWAIKETDA
jgi:hypothetical protein